MLSDFEFNLLLRSFESGVVDKEEICNFMAQCAHESADFKRMEESFKYRSGIQQIRAVVSSMKAVPDKELEAARVQAINGNPIPLADLMYNSQYRKNRMGNSEPGDGYKYRGRGIFQLTGKNNYAHMTELFGVDYGVDFVMNPDLILQSPYNELSALTYWLENVQPTSRKDVKKARKAINGGYNGLADVEKKYDNNIKAYDEAAKRATEMLKSIRTGLNKFLKFVKINK